eukprot:CAMPEP_0204575800 /NCGR_PEP_ID=MMETSP0661-20131031/41404_1 /ASSEMBLY_ACC=CAM_ASM_000606 /TAXON_ID=109239 /ORGANISM="Alexandrium margalefi, Strain AMGDE01CS-322" /LENGTH=66 /DNA_ID=CAMNT_0051584473 /DNA_START=116 /DNA_END=316 /DNA_ORIENTATION=-
MESAMARACAGLNGKDTSTENTSSSTRPNCISMGGSAPSGLKSSPAAASWKFLDEDRFTLPWKSME